MKHFALALAALVTLGPLTVESGNTTPPTLSDFGSILPGVVDGNIFWNTRDAVDYTFSFSTGIRQFGVGI